MAKTTTKKNETTKKTEAAPKAETDGAAAKPVKERPPLPEGIGTESMVLPTTYVALDQLEKHPRNDKWRMYPEGRIKELDSIITERPQDAALHPLRVVPAGKNTEDGRPIYYAVGGNHQLEIYQRQGWAGAPVIIQQGLDSVGEIAVMVTSNRTKPLAPLEIGRAFLLYVEEKGGSKKKGRSVDEKDLASRSEFARTLGVSEGYVRACESAAVQFEKFSKRTQKRIIDAEDRFTTRHFAALKKLKDLRDRERFAAWTVEDENTVGAKELERAITLYQGTINSSTFVKLSIGSLVEEPEESAPINIPHQPGGKAGAVAAGSRSGKVGSTAKPSLRDEAFKQATGAVKSGAEKTQEELFQEVDTHVGYLTKSHDGILDWVSGKLYGDHQKRMQTTMIEWLTNNLKRWKSMKLSLSLNGDGEEGEGEEEESVEGTAVPV